MRAILVALCLLLTALAFAPEASARPCVLEMGSNPNVCVYHYRPLDEPYSCVQVLTGTYPNLAPTVCVYENPDGELYLCHGPGGAVVAPGCHRLPVQP